MNYLQRLVDRASGAQRSPESRRALVFPPPKPALESTMQPTPTPTPRTPTSGTRGKPEVAAEGVVAHASTDVDQPPFRLEPQVSASEQALVDAEGATDGQSIDEPVPTEPDDRTDLPDVAASAPQDVARAASEPADESPVTDPPVNKAEGTIPEFAPQAPADHVIGGEVGTESEAQPLAADLPIETKVRSESEDVAFGRPAGSRIEQDGSVAPRTAAASMTVPPETHDQPIDVVIDTIEIVSEEAADQRRRHEPRTIGFADYQSLRAYELEA